MKIARNIAFFLVGGSAYVGLELLWRRRSHISMFAAGGLCFLLIGKLRHLPLPWPVRAVSGAGVITAVELGTGLLVNRDYSVWDYRDMPGNFHGQVCLPFFFLWIPLSIAAMGLHALAQKHLPE